MSRAFPPVVSRSSLHGLPHLRPRGSLSRFLYSKTSWLVFFSGRESRGSIGLPPLEVRLQGHFQTVRGFFMTVLGIVL